MPAAKKSPSRKKKSSGKFIQQAISKPGQLHRDLGVPQGQKIPASKIAAAAKKPGKVGQRARFAQTLAGMRKKKTTKKSSSSTSRKRK